MKKIIALLVTLVGIKGIGQDDLSVLTKPIVDEGKLLYKSEMASWYGTDLFLESYKDRANIGGYFSYEENEISKCIFFSRANEPKVIGAIFFDSTYDIKIARMELTEREFTNLENDLYSIRKTALETINSDTLFKKYNNTSFNVVPIIINSEKKVYVLTGAEQNGVVIFGNDYLLMFDKDNSMIAKRQLHRNIIPINYGGKEEEGKIIEGTIHSHSPETGDFITATDICTLMLYEKFTKWKQHNVVSKNYLNIWNCLTDELTVIPMDTINKIGKDRKKHNKKNK